VERTDRERQPKGVRAYRSEWSWIDASAYDSLGGRKLVVDLTGVAVIRRDGSHVLRDIKNRGIEVIRLAVSFAAAPLLSWPPSPFSRRPSWHPAVVGQPIQLPSSLFVILLLRAAVRFVEGPASGHAASFCSLLRRHSSLSRALAAAMSLFR